MAEDSLQIYKRPKHDNGGNDEVAEFLSSINLSQYTDAIKDAGAECLDDFKIMDKEDLEDFAGSLNMKKLHQIKFVKACLALADAPSTMATQDEQKQQKQEQPKQQHFGGFEGFRGFGGATDAAKNTKQNNGSFGAMSGMMGGFKGMMENMMNEMNESQGHGHGQGQSQKMQQQFMVHSQPMPQQQPVYSMQAQHNMHFQHQMHHQPTSASPMASGGKAICNQCQGSGFQHKSSHKHKWSDLKQRCLFCSDCKRCRGKGWVPTGGSASISQCPPCKGRGWVHATNHDHKNGIPSQRCIFCSNCKPCKGTGRI